MPMYSALGGAARATLTWLVVPGCGVIVFLTAPQPAIATAAAAVTAAMAAFCARAAWGRRDFIGFQSLAVGGPRAALGAPQGLAARTEEWLSLPERTRWRRPRPSQGS